jgi:hypothetical protein
MANGVTMSALFSLGSVVISRNCLAYVQEMGIDIFGILTRHASGDWGDVDPEDRAANEVAIFTPARIFSVYELSQGRIWVITEADRSSTCVMLPRDY